MSESSATSYVADPDGLDPSPEYRPVSSWAVVGLLMGLASVLAFVHPMAWVVPIIGTALSAGALYRLRTAVPPQIGRRAALIGLTLSLLFGTTAVTRCVVFRWQLRAETLQAGKQWFEALREGNPYAAHQFTSEARQVKPDDDLVVRYSEPHARKQIEEYIEEPAVRLLLSLGPYARVRYYRTEALIDAPENAGASHTYAVSVVQDGKSTSCFVQLRWARNFDYESKDWQWRLSAAEFMKRPPAGWIPPADARAG